MSGEIVCSFVELDVLGVALRLDVRQFPFSIPHFAVEAEERLRLGQAAQDELIARRLIRRDDFAPELVQTLNVYARGRVAIAMRGVADQEQHLALAVIDDHAGVLAVQEGEALRFELAQPDSVIRRLVGLLPPLSPGPGTSVTVTAKPPPTARRRVDEDFSEFTFTSTVRAAGHSPAAQRAAAEDILRQPRLGGGDFLVTARSRNSRQSTPITMNWLDTQAGRYAVLNSTDCDGRLQATYTPADLAALDRHLTNLVRNVS
ncbi:ESAT-6 protein secretion system EspG family protein [Lentzea atacamensis]|uniref:ESAT-6 protein secretion system EspG family protein n=1 Tax=Lentzea atacamensis TaxID=531938 RepID=A0ABX9DW68_9PSEU|nr:ESX secretion-associated protein EspG [Lentzea atacamensis]RAS59226.1 ESAT-6 protein secretion system EspG family protein [Lentzea atacamensis]